MTIPDRVLSRLFRTVRGRLPIGFPRSRSTGAGVEDVVELIGRLAALSRAGLPAARIWAVLAEAGSPTDALAAVVAAVTSTGGTTGEGLRLAAAGLDGRTRAAVGWLAMTSDVVDRSGAPPGLVLDGVAAGIRADLADHDDREAALAGPRATVMLLTALPVSGLGLGALMGAHPLAVLLGDTAGRACLLTAAGLWLAGRRWMARMVRVAATAGTDGWETASSGAAAQASERRSP